MAVVDCPYCFGEGIEKSSFTDHVLICTECGGTGKIIGISIDEMKNRRFDILIRNNSKKIE